DRIKDMICSGGENVYPAEVENAIHGHPHVAEVAVIGVPDEKWGEVGVMVTILAPGQTATEEELQEFCRQRLARYKVPRHVVFTDALPYSPYGKVIKAELRQRYLVTE
ncbi:MAG TPA: long-chain fatty acid--CoA ligase, partial [Chloroflexota bacterium]|nr:long-chain fatty acid--CoA ligase [Chloroflexota bacterium]